MVRIQDSQSWHRGSIPLSTTKESLLRMMQQEAFCVKEPTEAIFATFMIIGLIFRHQGMQNLA